jgi:hypothetical protein
MNRFKPIDCVEDYEKCLNEIMYLDTSCKDRNYNKEGELRYGLDRNNKTGFTVSSLETRINNMNDWLIHDMLDDLIELKNCELEAKRRYKMIEELKK